MSQVDTSSIGKRLGKKIHLLKIVVILIVLILVVVLIFWLSSGPSNTCSGGTPCGGGDVLRSIILSIR